MSGPYIPKFNEKQRIKVEHQLIQAKLSEDQRRINKFSKMLQALDEQIINRENTYYNREVEA